MILTNNSNYPVGLDISDLSIKLVQLRKIRDKIKIQALGKLGLDEGIIANGEIKNRTELIKAVRKIMSAPQYGKVSSSEVIACLPESKTFVKLIEVQKSPNSFADVIGTEIEKNLPLSVSEIYFDWQVIEERPDKYLILVGAAPKDIVNQYTSLLDDAKCSPTALEIEPVAIARCLLKEEAPRKISAFGAKEKIVAKENYGILDIGASHTCMIFYAGGTILFTVSLPISGEKITAEIADSLKLTPEQAEKAKIICGLDESKANGVIKEILSGTVKNLAAKMKEAIGFYENYFNRYGALNKILLCGGGSNIAEIDRIISQELGREVSLADSLANTDEKKEEFDKIFVEKHSLNLKEAKLGSDGPENNLSVKQSSNTTFTTAFGLALRGLFIDEL